MKRNIIIPDNVSDKDREIMAVVDALKENDIENRIQGEVYVKKENEETIGAYNFDSDEYLTKEELDVRYYMDRIQTYTGKEPDYFIIPIRIHLYPNKRTVYRYAAISSASNGGGFYF